MMKTEFKEGDKFVFELGKKLGPLDAYEIVGMDRYVRTDQLRKLTPYVENDKLAVQMAYYKGFDDGIKKCTERLKSLNDEVRGFDG